MIRRWLELVLLSTVLGWGLWRYTGLPWMGWTGSVAGAGLWGVLDNLRAARAMKALRDPESRSDVALVGVWGDVVDRARKGFKALNRRARKSEARLQEFLAAIQASPDGVVLLNREQGIEWSNLTAGTHLGFDPKRDLQQPIRNMVRDPVFIEFLNMGDFSQAVEIDGRLAFPGHPHRISIQIHRYGKGRKLLITRDVTAVQQAEVMRRDFVANVSHEIRTPLTVVSGFLETLMNLDLSRDEQQHYLQLMHQQAERMQTLVSDLLTLSRLEGSPAPSSGEWMSAQSLVEQVVAEARALSSVLVAGDHHIGVESGPALEVAGARAELVSALSNLLSNAVRYTPAGGHITAGWKLLADGSAEFWVTDTGPGIEAEHLPRLTERFYRADRSRSRETGGTGLGLAIVKHVAQRHGGQVVVDSEVGQGSRFAITLPPSRVLAG